MFTRKRKLELVYFGTSFAEADAAGLNFWRAASTAAKKRAMRELIEDAEEMKGRSRHALRLLRTTAVIKFS